MNNVQLQSALSSDYRPCFIFFDVAAQYFKVLYTVSTVWPASLRKTGVLHHLSLHGYSVVTCPPFKPAQVSLIKIIYKRPVFPLAYKRANSSCVPIHGVHPSRTDDVTAVPILIDSKVSKTHWIFCLGPFWPLSCLGVGATLLSSRFCNSEENFEKLCLVFRNFTFRKPCRGSLPYNFNNPFLQFYGQMGSSVFLYF